MSGSTRRTGSTLDAGKPREPFQRDCTESPQDLSRIIAGDAAVILGGVPAGSARCVVTSPPYWGLRDYGIDGQIGLEPSLVEYVEKVVSIFRLVRTALADDGTAWINLGDLYSTQPPGARGPAIASSTLTNPTRQLRVATVERGDFGGLRRKQLVGLPWRVAFALQADGWLLRQDIIWSKPNPMPESVRDRPTRSHEYVFLLAKSARYYYDGDAVREPLSRGARAPAADIAQRATRIPSGRDAATRGGSGLNGRSRVESELQDKREGRDRRRVDLNDSRVPGRGREGNPAGTVRSRNRRSVWTLPTQPYHGAHFATFPTELARLCVLAGSARGDLVLDPFCGAGTVGVVAAEHERRFLGVEINPEYASIARQRIGGRQLRLHLRGCARAEERPS